MCLQTEYLRQYLPSCACPMSSSFLPCSMPQTHRPSRSLGSKQAHHMAKQGTQPVHRGPPAPHHLRSCLLPSSHSSQEQPLHKPKPLQKHIPWQETLTNPQVEQKGQVPAGRVSPPKDLWMEKSRLEGHVDVLGAVDPGQPLPTVSPVPRAGEGPLFTMCVG